MICESEADFSTTRLWELRPLRFVIRMYCKLPFSPVCGSWFDVVLVLAHFVVSVLQHHFPLVHSQTDHRNAAVLRFLLRPTLFWVFSITVIKDFRA